MTLVCWFLELYFFALLGRIILSWFPVAPGGFLAALNSALYTVTEPVLGPFRRMIPPVRIGMAGVDLSPMFLLLGLRLITAAIGC